MVDMTEVSMLKSQQRQWELHPAFDVPLAAIAPAAVAVGVGVENLPVGVLSGAAYMLVVFTVAVWVRVGVKLHSLRGEAVPGFPHGMPEWVVPATFRVMRNALLAAGVFVVVATVALFVPQAHTFGLMPTSNLFGVTALAGSFLGWLRVLSVARTVCKANPLQPMEQV